MRQKTLLVFLLILCLTLCACGNNVPATDPPAPPTDTTEQQPPDTGTSVPPDSPESPDSPAPSITPAELTVELVLEWETADALLSQLEDMSDMLYTALEEVGYPMDRITLTISTAGGFTAESLAQGGIDAAILPAVDFLTCSASTAGIAMSCEDVSETVIALSLAKGTPSSEFCTALFDALTSTAHGQEFLALCRPGAVFAAPTDEAMQAVMDWVAEQEKQSGGGHA